MVNGSSYLSFHRGHGSLMGATHTTSQCDEAFVVKRILDLPQEKCASKKDERTMQTEEHFLSSLGLRRTAWCLFCAHIKPSESLELASVIPTWSLRRPSYLIYPFLFPSSKTGVSIGCRRHPLYTSEFSWLDGAHSNPLPLL